MQIPMASCSAPRRLLVPLALAACVVAYAEDALSAEVAAELDDECAAVGGEACALSALQLRAAPAAGSASKVEEEEVKAVEDSLVTKLTSYGQAGQKPYMCGAGGTAPPYCSPSSICCASRTHHNQALCCSLGTVCRFVENHVAEGVKATVNEKGIGEPRCFGCNVAEKGGCSKYNATGGSAYYSMFNHPIPAYLTATTTPAPASTSAAR